MEKAKLFYVKYVGSGVVTLGRAGKFMPGTGAYLGEEEARAAAAREDFEVEGLDGAAEAPKPPAKVEPAKVEPAKVEAAKVEPAKVEPAKVEPAKVEPAKVEPAKPEPPKAAAPAKPKPEPEPKHAKAEAPEPAAAPTPTPAPALAKNVLAWRSERTQCDTRLVRWGHAGRPVLFLAPAGGDAETVERMQLVDALGPLLDEGKVRLYSVDDVAGRALVDKAGDPAHRMWLLNQLHEYLAREVVPAIQSDGGGDVIAAGAGLGALHAAALVCRYPDLFSHALCASGVFKLEPFLDGAEPTDDLRAASPLLAVPALGDGAHLDRLRGRFVVLAAGDEDASESFALAEALGQKGVPNRVDPWGAAAGREWSAWRKMVPKYIAEWA